ncbi:MAG: hypothetical protein KIH63_004690 [Candidatus Saccharibacteria bacterium]|nr:hypothetical protein [Candidatus Saccharibacteria bacterium]
MDMIAELEKRVAELTKASEQSAGNHNMLIGRLTESQELLGLLKAKAAAEPLEGEVVVDAGVASGEMV